MIAFARPIAAALGSVDATGPIKVMALVVMIVGVFAVPSAQLVRDFKQDKLFLAEVISFVPSTVILLLLAKSGSGAMAFAWSRVVAQFVSGFVLFVSVPKNYRPGFARSALSPLFRFGLPLGGANVINYILLNADYALVGHIMGAVALGTYVLAFNVASWPASLLGAMINNVSMPAFSRVKDDAELLRVAIASSVRAVSLVVMPISALTMTLALPLVLTLYGAKWSASAEVLSVLSIYGTISIICVLFANMLVALGRMKAILVVQLVWLSALVPAMVLGVHRGGIVGAAVAHIAVIGPIVLPSYLLVLKRASGVRLTELARAILPALSAALSVAIIANKTASQFASPAVKLIVGLLAGGLIYIIATAPQAIELLNRGRTANLRGRRVLRLYRSSARLVGLPVSTPPKHAARSGTSRAQQASPAYQAPGWTERRPARVIEGASADAAQSAAAALALLMSLARPEAAAPPVAWRTPAYVIDEAGLETAELYRIRR